MSCVCLVSYSILINGSPYGDITPMRGLRQGDLLSLYLFLLCAEMLTQKLNQQEDKGHIKGIAISNNGPRVSHLLFADDSLFFCQANFCKMETLSRVLTFYDNLSGQQVNVAKSSIIFGLRVFESNR
ncbi:putative mitochondrial protein [Cardamine amara subsp. amara]|uniref:Mitochondrial protein n=1 Tax=Cardamine amara subsp. amara TaxID=228776 RepID=A0ABD1BNR3_CARAN